MLIRAGDIIRVSAKGLDETKCVERVLETSGENMYKVYDTDNRDSHSTIYEKDIKQIMVNGNWIQYSPQAKKKPFII